MKRAEAQAILGGLAADQYGLVTSTQAKAHGVDGVTLLRLREAGLLEGVGRGVYLVSGAVTPSHLEIRVAWLRLDPARPAWERDGRGEKDGVVSHRSACLVHELGDIPAPKVELTVPRRLTTREAWVTLHQHAGPLDPGEIAVVDGLPVTSVERTVLDLLRDGADAGHIGGVIAEAEHRGLLDVGALAEQAGQFANRYAMPKASGAELLSALAAEAGQRLNQEVALDVVRRIAAAGALAGYEDAVRQLVHLNAPAQARLTNTDLARILAPLHETALRAVELQNPAIAALNESVLTTVTAQLEPLRDTLRRIVELRAAITAFNQTAAAKAAEQLTSLTRILPDVSGQSAPHLELAKAALPSETIAALERAAAVLNDPKVMAALSAAAQREDDVSEEAP
jgi:hypothetical protein